MSEVEKWVKNSTKESLISQFSKHSISCDNITKLSKLELVNILIANGVERETRQKTSTKRKSDDEPSTSQRIKKPKTSKPETPLKILVAKIKERLDEPDVVELKKTCIEGLHSFDNLLLNSNNIVVGKLDEEGKGVVLLERDDIEKSLGQRFDFDRLRIAQI